MNLAILPPSSLHIDNEPISRVGDTEEEKSFKLLGMHMDETLNMETSHRKSLLKDLSFQLHNTQNQTHITYIQSAYVTDMGSW